MEFEKKILAKQLYPFKIGQSNCPNFCDFLWQIFYDWKNEEFNGGDSFVIGSKFFWLTSPSNNLLNRSIKEIKNSNTIDQDSQLRSGPTRPSGDL